MAYTDKSLYVDSVAYAAVAMWTASTVYAVGQIVRQRAAVAAVGNERCYVCILAGTSLASEPSWLSGSNINKGAIVTEAAGPKWQECTGHPAMNGDLTSVPSWLP